MKSGAPLLVTEALLRVTTGLSASASPPVPLDEETWLETIRLASAHLVLPALASGLDACGPAWIVPGDARDYLDAMRTANAARNRRLKAALASVIASLQAAGIDPLAVKGAAFLMTEAKAPSWRFLGDLDLIVSPELLGRAVEVLNDIGFRSDAGDYDPRRDAHAPAMLGADGETIVELHDRPFADGHWPELEAALWWDRTVVSTAAIDVSIPSPEVRVAYLLLHSQEHHAYFAQTRLLLRDLLDLAMLARDKENLDWRAALRHVPERSQDRVLALLAAGAQFGIPMPGINFSSPQRAWAELARNRLSQLVFHRQLTAALGMAGHEARRLVDDPQRTLRLAKSIVAPGMLGRKILKKLGKFRDRAAG